MAPKSIRFLDYYHLPCSPLNWYCCLCKATASVQGTDSHLQHPKHAPPASARPRSGSLPNCRYANAAARTGAATYGGEKRSRAMLVPISLNWRAAMPASKVTQSGTCIKSCQGPFAFVLVL